MGRRGAAGRRARGSGHGGAEWAPGGALGRDGGLGRPPELPAGPRPGAATSAQRIPRPAARRARVTAAHSAAENEAAQRRRLAAQPGGGLPGPGPACRPGPDRGRGVRWQAHVPAQPTRGVGTSGDHPEAGPARPGSSTTQGARRGARDWSLQACAPGRRHRADGPGEGTPQQTHEAEATLEQARRTIDQILARSRTHGEE